jgi:hypothetical protein
MAVAVSSSMYCSTSSANSASSNTTLREKWKGTTDGARRFTGRATGSPFLFENSKNTVLIFKKDPKKLDAVNDVFYECANFQYKIPCILASSK